MVKGIGIFIAFVAFLYILAFFPLLAVVYGIALGGYILYVFITDIVVMVRIMLENEENERKTL